jgi:hypothetical protein
MTTKGVGAGWVARGRLVGDPNALAVSEFPYGRRSVCARMPSDLTIRCGEEFYPDRGMLEVHPLTNVAMGQFGPCLTARSAWSLADQHRRYHPRQET